MAELQVPDQTKRAQQRAADPHSSAWVSANAGSGKTYVLAQRVVRLMLEGTHPARILCLTFTNAAAAEMANRVFGLLARWTMAPELELEREIRAMIGKRPSTHQSRRARQLFALALDAPGGLKIQTIHAFCESLLHQFPLEANVTGHFTILDDYTQISILEEARRNVLLAAGDSDPDLAQAYSQAMAYGSDDAIQKAIDELTTHRSDFGEWIEAGIDRALAPIAKELGISLRASQEEVEEQAYRLLNVPDSFFKTVIDGTLANGEENNIRQGTALEAVLEAPRLWRQTECLGGISVHPVRHTAQAAAVRKNAEAAA